MSKGGELSVHSDFLDLKSPLVVDGLDMTKRKEDVLDFSALQKFNSRKLDVIEMVTRKEGY